MGNVRGFSCHLDSQNPLGVYRNSHNLPVNLTVLHSILFSVYTSQNKLEWKQSLVFLKQML